MPQYEPSIGLEVHAELSTRTKVFCGCSTAVGAPPNTQVCPVCLGFPGVLPVLNRQVVEYALRAALAMRCSVSRPSIFERKGYYYPDLPKNFQISQKRSPLGVDGYIEIGVNGDAKQVRISDVHIEEDAAKLLHPETDPDHSLVDFNRGGLPLLEIVSQPDMHSVAEVQAYMTAVQSMLRYLGISEARMEQGQLRFEASVSLAPEGAKQLGTRVEIKNLNSFRAVVGAVEHEIRRQARALNAGEKLVQETRLWDDERSATEPMRTKETAMDYRYFPEPDLVPLEIDDEWIARVRSELPELAEERKRRLVEQYALSDYDAGILTGERALADLFEQTVAAGAPAKPTANWITGRLLYHINERGLGIEHIALKPLGLAELVQMVESGAITGPAARQVLDRIVESGESPKAVVAELGLAQISDAGDIASVVAEVIAENADAVENYRKGKEAALKFLVGQVMRKSKGRANPQTAAELLKQRLAAD
ncbi:MAG: Asp-tRNA(Asn)/Glu-tRNA(Gln) amidotransferase subunit GatB [Armatimonadota bacterium]